jgi:hypothetical protein
VVFANVHSCFSWDSSYDLTLQLYVGLRVCDALFSCCFLPVAYPYVDNVLFAQMACLILLMSNYARLLTILIESFIIIVIVMTLYFFLWHYSPNLSLGLHP